MRGSMYVYHVTQTAPSTTKPQTPQPYDFTRILRYEGRDGLRCRYRALAPFTHLLLLCGDSELLLKAHWYRSLRLCTTLSSLQAQWEALRQSDALPWVASRFWTEQVYVLREMCKDSSTETAPEPPPHNPFAPKPPAFVMPSSLDEYLESEEFENVCRALERIDKEERRNPYAGVAA